MAESKGITFEVEPGLTQGGKYGADSRRYREPEQSDSLPQAWRKMAPPGGSVEAMSPPLANTVAVFTKQNLFAKAVHAAFFGHHPLVLSPDVIWLTIAQGLANHVDQNAETLRSAFVSHEGKKKLEIERPSFVKGSAENDWEGVFPEFSDLIKANSVPGTVELIQCDFSTTGPVERVVSHITLMDAVQHYFTYSMACGCGFPSITLSGTVGDWKQIRAKAEALSKYDLDWWLEGLLPALDHFVSAAEGEPDLAFWRSLCMINTGLSFPDYSPLSGWVQVFFPYLIIPGADFDRFVEAKESEPRKKLRRNTAIVQYVESFTKKIDPSNYESMGELSGLDAENPVGVGVQLENFPPALSNAPFTYKDLGTGLKHEMSFMGGVTCIVQHANGSIEPKVGWAVMDSGRSTPIGGAGAALVAPLMASVEGVEGEG